MNANISKRKRRSIHKVLSHPVMFKFDPFEARVWSNKAIKYLLIWNGESVARTLLQADS